MLVVSARAVTSASRDRLLGGVEGCSSGEPVMLKALRPTAKIISAKVVSLLSAFASAITPKPSERDAAMAVDTPGAPPLCRMICQ